MSTTLRPAPPAAPLPAPAFPRVPQTTRPAGPTIHRRTQLASEGWSTPRILQALLLASLLLAVLLFIAGYTAYMTMRQNVQAVGQDSVPSILAAQQIHASLVDLDANAANDLLAGAGGSRTARDSYNADRSLIGRQVVTASQNITYGNLERLPIETLQDGMTYYTGLIATAQQQLQDNPNNRPAVIASYTQASNYLHTVLVPAAQRLDDVNSAYFNQAYGNVSGSSVMVSAFVLIVGILLLAALIGAQLFLTRHTRRMLNLPLLAATVLLVIFLFDTLGTVGTVRTDLTTAKVGAFNAVADLSSARALVYDANGAQTLSILDSANMMRYQTQFDQETKQIADVRVTQAIITQAMNNPKNPGFNGLLANELKNLTSSGEKDAAIAALTEFGNFQTTDMQLRGLLAMGQIDQARALATGTNTDQAHRAFERLDIALVRTININQSAFDNAVTGGFTHVAPLQWQAPVVAFLIGVLAFLGLQPRMREYAV